MKNYNFYFLIFIVIFGIASALFMPTIIEGHGGRGRGMGGYINRRGNGYSDYGYGGGSGYGYYGGGGYGYYPPYYYTNYYPEYYYPSYNPGYYYPTYLFA